MSLFRKKKGERRSAYRVGATASDGKLWLGLPSGPAEATLHDVNARGCGCQLPTDVGKAIREGDSLKVRIAIGGAGVPQLYLRAIVRSIQKKEKGYLYFGLEFQDVERVFTQLRDHQWRYFNRRAAFRVAPLRSDGEREVARFIIPGSKTTHNFPLHDLSATGLSLSLRRTEPVEFPENTNIQVKFQLDGHATPFDLRVRLVHRTNMEGRLRIGFHIDVEATPLSEEQCDSIADYVIERQRLALATV